LKADKSTANSQLVDLKMPKNQTSTIQKSEPIN